MKKKVKKTIFECIVIIIVGTSLFFFTHRNGGKEKEGVDGTYVEKNEKADKPSEAESEETNEDSDTDAYEDTMEALESGSGTEDELERAQADKIQLEIRDMSETVAGLIVDREAFEYALKQRHMRTIASNRQIVTCTNKVEYKDQQEYFYFLDETGNTFAIVYNEDSKTYTYTLNWEE